MTRMEKFRSAIYLYQGASGKGNIGMKQAGNLYFLLKPFRSTWLFKISECVSV